MIIPAEQRERLLAERGVTTFMRKKKLQAMVGGCIMELHQAETGEINRCRVEWMPFYDRGFYEKTDKYRNW